MKRRQSLWWYWTGAIVLAVGYTAGAGPLGLVGYWTFDEGQGATAFDSSGNGLHGALRGNPTWVTGQLGGALDFNGTTAYVEIPHHPLLSLTSEITIAAWTNMRTTSSGEMAIVSKGSWAANNLPYELTEERGAVIFWQFYNDAGRDDCSPNSPSAGEWHHIAATYDGRIFKCYIDGRLGEQSAYAGAMPTNTMAVTIGRRSGGGTFFNGRIDDVQLWKRALPEAEINKIMTGLADASVAQDPDPEDQTVDVPRDTVLSWKAGEYAATHDVYLGTTFADVNTASRTAAKGVLAGQGQADTAFDPPAALAYGQTYYWRIDEVNKAPGNAIFQGSVWSFTVEPYGYPVKPVSVTASSAQSGMGPEKTIDGSGLDKSDQHGTEPATMWLSTGAQPNWIRYEFDQVYKLHDLKVWNSNQLVEGFLGFGARKVTVETSVDGIIWTPVAGVPEFSRAPGLPGYAANTTVSLGGTEAKYVRLTITANWGGMAPQAGLAEVRFSSVPVQARAPQPATAATNVRIDTALNWRPGREAASHKVFLGTDQAAVTTGTALAKTVTDHRLVPDSLTFGTTYYWRVDEVNAVTYPGSVWSFTTQEYAVIDDFESYTDKAGQEVFTAWIDGFTGGTNGSTVGYLTANGGTFGETTIIHGGKQSMPMAYDNTKAPFFSEAEHTFSPAQDWTNNGAENLVVYFRGIAPAFAETAAGSIVMNAIGTDIWNNSDQFRFACKTLSGDGTMVARVDAIANSNVWAKGGVMIRQNIQPGSVHAFMPITPGGAGAGNGASFQRRLTANGASTNNDSTSLVAAPYWVKIERKGNAFSGFISPDGKTWTQLGTPQTITMTNPVLIGLALCSHDAAIATGATFSNVATTGNVTGTWQVAEIGAAQPAGNSVEGLYVTVKDSSGKTKTVQHPDAAATAYMSWQPWTIPLNEFTSAGVKMSAVKSLTVGVGNKAAPKAGGTGTVYIDDIGYGRAVR